MTPERRRLWIVIGLSALTAVGLGLAWWLRPAPPAPDALYPPIEGEVVVPPLPPPPPPAADPDPDSDASDSDGAAETADEAEGDLLVDLDLGPAYLGRTVDGAAVRPSNGRIRQLPSGSFAPNLTGITGIALANSQLLIEASSVDGSVVYLGGVEELGSLLPIRLAGWPDERLGGARARDPVLTGGGAWLIAEAPTGGALVWRVDLAEGSAAPVAAAGWPAGRAPTGLTAAGEALFATAGRADLLRLEDGTWRSIAPGAAGITSTHAAQTPGAVEVVLARNGRVYLWTPDRTVPESVAIGTHPQRLVAGTAYVDGGLVWVQPDRRSPTSAGALQLLADRPIVALSAGRLAWMRPDGRLGILTPDAEPEALELGISGVSALAGDGGTIVVLGQVGTERSIEIIEL